MMISIPKKDLYALNYFTIGLPAPVMIAAYSPDEQKQIDLLNKEEKKNLIRWSKENHFMAQIL